MKRKNSKPYIFLLLVAIILIVGLNRPSPQTIAPDCFSRDDCWVPLTEGYCSANYDCIAGKCYSEQINCPEVCGSGKDEDKDGTIDCMDRDCWNSPNCHCNLMNYGNCVVGRCYCPPDTEPRWSVAADDHWCSCI